MDALPLLVAGSAVIAGAARRTPVPAPLLLVAAGMRGVVSLAIAFSIPLTVDHGEPFPARNLVLFLTFTTVIATLVVQGLTLAPLIRLLKLPPRDVYAETLAEAQAQSEASSAAEARLEELLADRRNALPQPLADRLRAVLERRRNAVWNGWARSTRRPGNRRTPCTGVSPGR